LSGFVFELTIIVFANSSRFLISSSFAASRVSGLSGPLSSSFPSTPSSEPVVALSFSPN